jgi:hypothetical protein
LKFRRHRCRQLLGQLKKLNWLPTLKLENISSFAKDNRIKTLEELVLKIGYDPSNVKAVKEMLEKKNVDIPSLRKQFKLPPTEDSREKEIAETEGEKHEMLKLIMEKNVKLKEMEAELEKLVKEKEKSNPMEVIPLSAIPLTGVSTASVVEIPSATPLTALEKIVELVKSMEEMNLQRQRLADSKRRLRTFRNSRLLTKLATPRKNKCQTSSNRNYNNFKSKQWQAKHSLKSRKVSRWISPNP